MKITRDIHDLVGGLLMTAAGGYFAVHGSHYSFRTAARLGPGYFPVVLGCALAVLGLLVAIPAWWRRGQAIEVQWKNLGWSIFALVFFAAALHRLGLVPASFVACVLALAPSAMRLRTRLVVCAAVALLTFLIFPVGLQMALPLWPWSA